MTEARDLPAAPNEALLRWLTGMMFLMFAMTTDAVGSVIPKIVAEFHLSLTDASAFQWVPMVAIGAGALLLGFLADALGRRATIILGLLCFGVASLAFAFGSRFAFFVSLMALSGLGIAIFKIGALALVGDISRTTEQHTSTMNLIEGFFGVGSIVGPVLIASLIAHDVSWKWLYVIASGVCAVLVVTALIVRYPRWARQESGVLGFGGALRMLGGTLRMVVNPYAFGFSLLICLYVAVENAVVVWLPTYMQGYRGSLAWLPAAGLTIFFVLRAAGRFLGAWLLSRMRWATVLVLLGGAILACFLGTLAGGKAVGALLLPFSGLFMSMLYPTINSKGISCFPRHEHGSVAGVILFFTALAAGVGPLAMAKVSDVAGDVAAGFQLAAAFAALLFAGLLYNWWREPAAKRLALGLGTEGAGA
jgi:fucose permease